MCFLIDMEQANDCFPIIVNYVIFIVNAAVRHVIFTSSTNECLVIYFILLCRLTFSMIIDVLLHDRL